MRPLVLLSNDDSVFSDGIRTLAQAIRVHADVIVVAPLSEQSAKSHALTLTVPLRMHKVGALEATAEFPEVPLFAVDGTPADCVYVALLGNTLPRVPDLVLSGINHGYNLGSDTYYSGTVAAAREAALRGHRAIAFSAGPGSSFEAAAKTAWDICARALEAPKPFLWNVNFPAQQDFRGIRVVRLGSRHYQDEVLARNDPRGREYFWIGGPAAFHHSDPGSDTDACDQGFISLTPLMLDQTDHNALTAANLVFAADK